MRILVAEDERDLNALVVKRLKQEKYSVDACYDGEAVFDYMRNAEYDVLIAAPYRFDVDSLCW